MKHEPILDSLPNRWDDFLNTLFDRLASPSPALPSVRCLYEHTLSKIFKEIQRELSLPTTFPSGVKILRHLKAMGLAAIAPIEDVSEDGPSKKFYLIGIKASHDVDADPLELLQAYKQDGVICYFSALSYYNLTTQVPTHHHIATLLTPSKRQQIELLQNSVEEHPIQDSVKRAKLGTRAFSYQGVPFFITKRQKNTIPGVKLRVLNPRTQIRMTTIEQTLLDTLQYPYRCGGPEVIFESWRSHINKLNESLILKYLEIIDIQPLTRRVGAMFDFIDYQPGSELSHFLNNAKAQILNIYGVGEIHLFKGINYFHLNQDWKVFSP